MNIFTSKTEKHLSKINEEIMYDKIAKEIKSGRISDGIWTKALTRSNGDRNKTESEYIRLRLQMMHSEADALTEISKLHSQQIHINNENISKDNNKESLKPYANWVRVTAGFTLILMLGATWYVIVNTHLLAGLMPALFCWLLYCIARGK